MAPTFGEIDIYVFDQLLKGRFDSARRVLDAGCGEGRNLHYLLAAGCDYAQGYLFARPMPGEAFDAMLKAQAEVQAA